MKRFNNNKIDVQDLLSILSKYSLVPSDHHMSVRQNTSNNPTENSQAVTLFQQVRNTNTGCQRNFQALNTSNSTSSQRAATPDLNNFLQNQLHRHRKRARSPNSPMDTNASPNSLNNHQFFKRKRL